MEAIDNDKRIDTLKDENAVFFHHKRQDLKSKIYNKLEDLKLHHYNTSAMTGLLHDHITTPLWSGAMLSKNLQKLYIWRYCDYKKASARFKKLMEYRKACNNIECMKYAEKDTYAAGHFEKMGLSPLYCSNTIGYIPAFKDLLNGTEDDRIREFLKNQNPDLLRLNR